MRSTVRSDLIRALAELHKRGPFDAVLLETTGLADPAPVAFSFMKSAVVKCNYKLDAILCLVRSTPRLRFYPTPHSETCYLPLSKVGSVRAHPVPRFPCFD